MSSTFFVSARMASALLATTLVISGCSDSKDTVVVQEVLGNNNTVNTTTTGSLEEITTQTLFGASDSDQIQLRELSAGFTRVIFDITVPAYASDELQMSLTSEVVQTHGIRIEGETWKIIADFPNNSVSPYLITFSDRNGAITLATIDSRIRTGTESSLTKQLAADQFFNSGWDDDGDGVSNLSELISGFDPLVAGTGTDQYTAENTPEVPVPSEPSNAVTHVTFTITVPEYASNELQIRLSSGGVETQGSWLVDQSWTVSANFPNNSSNPYVLTFFDRNGGIVLATINDSHRTQANASDTVHITADQFSNSGWDDDGDGISNLAELISGSDPLVSDTQADSSGVAVAEQDDGSGSATVEQDDGSDSAVIEQDDNQVVPETELAIGSDNYLNVLRTAAEFTSATSLLSDSDRIHTLASELWNGHSANTLSEKGLTLISEEPFDRGINHQYNCDAGGSMVLPIYNEALVGFVIGMSFDACFVGADLYDGTFFSVDIPRPNRITRDFDQFSAELADGSSFSIDGSYSLDSFRVGVIRTDSWEDTDYIKKDASGVESKQLGLNWTSSITRYRNLRRQAAYVALADGTVGFAVPVDNNASVVAEFNLDTGSPELGLVTVSTDLRFDGNYYGWVRDNFDELDNFVTPTFPVSDLGNPLEAFRGDRSFLLDSPPEIAEGSEQWDSGSLLVSSADGSQVVMSPTVESTETIDVQLNGASEVLTHFWSEGLQVKCPDPIIGC